MPPTPGLAVPRHFAHGEPWVYFGWALGDLGQCPSIPLETPKRTCLVGLGLPQRQGGRGVCCPVVPVGKAAYAEPGSSVGQWAAREELGCFSQASLAQPSTVPTAHGSPPDPKERLHGHSEHQGLS